MGFYEDIAELTGISYPTFHMTAEDTQVSVQLSSAAVATRATVADLKPQSGLELDENDVVLTTGQTVSTWADEQNLEIVQLTESAEGDFWVHAFKYDTLADYQVGYALLVPAAELRV